MRIKMPPKTFPSGICDGYVCREQKLIDYGSYLKKN